ncbi:hypothetical protein STVIR_3369 [Streptomyces viridochromogenes Tue57]|uniref:Uncharacterized protein n=1 Tax=Streptomyces viridochromogenes Tue57 TaxID=1160705 RepID=L8PHL6_STRVR|nr:hypothetical protein STVIR_3369 [Streptomyces viridochromogenes Tue57]
MPVAALRVLRTAAGRRALQLVLLVGGLFAIGFLCGEQAHAADGVSVGTASTSSADLRAAPRALAPTDHARLDGDGDGNSDGDGDGQALRSLTDRVAQTVGTRAAQPVGDVVRTVTEDLAEAAQAKVPPPASLPSLPSAPESPTWPSRPGLELPGLPQAPVLPQAPDFPGFPAPGVPAVPPAPGHTLPAPVTGTPQPESPAPASADRRDDEERVREEATGVHGPRFVVDAAVFRASVSADPHRTAPSGYAPAHQARAEHPGGVLGNRSAGDSGSSRHGDAHAVALHQRAPLRLIAGVVVRVDADGIRDRHRDIPVSPA